MVIAGGGSGDGALDSVDLATRGGQVVSARVQLADAGRAAGLELLLC